MTLVAPQIQGEFQINNETFGWVLAAFTLTYALLQFPAGLLADRFDVRWLYLGAVVWWSAAGIASALASTLTVLIFCRALLGMGESFNWPCALKATARVLEPADRGLGNGIFNSGAAVGGVITPLIVPFLTIRFGWRTAFVVVGALGFVWVIAWLIVSKGELGRQLALPSRSKNSVSKSETHSRQTDFRTWLAFSLLVTIAVSVGVSGCYAVGPVGCWLGVATLMVGLLAVARILPLDLLGTSGWPRSLGEVVRLRRFWVLVVVTISINICWHFLISWLPKYLNGERKMSALVGLVESFLSNDDPNREKTAVFLVSSLLTSLIFLAADAGNLLGGLFSRKLSDQGLSPSHARVWAMAICVLAISCGAWVGQIKSDYLALVLIGIMAFGAAAFMANYFAFCQEVDPNNTGLVVGILGGMGNLFAAGIQPFAGWVKDSTGSFGPIFILVGLSPFVGLLALSLGWKEHSRGSFQTLEPN